VDEVDIYVNGASFLTDVGFRQATNFMNVPAGVDLNIVVAPAGAGIENGVGPFTVNLTENETYIAIASGIVSASGYDPASPFSLEVFAGARETAVEDDEVDVLVFHGVTDAPSVNVGARFVGTLVTDAEYTDFAGYLSVPASYFTLDIAANVAPDDVIVSFGADLRALAGSSVSVIASGFLNPANNSNGAGFALIAVLADGTVVELPVVQEFEGTLGGLVEVPANLSNGSGTVGVTLAGNVLQLAGSFSDLTGTYTMSHIHRGAAGNNGGVAFALTADAGNGDWSAFENIFDLTSTDIDELNNGELYVNLHTNQFPAGEIRAQILASPNNAPSASEITAPADGAEITLTGTPDTPFVPSWSIATDPDSDNVVYVWQLAADSEFNTIIVNASTGANAQFEADYGTVDALLDAAGVNIGDEITLYHRAISTDGSEVTIGTAASVVITRGFVGDFARAQIIHNAADLAAANVDVFVNGEIFVPNFAFRTATPFVDLPAGVELTIDIAPAGAGIENSVFDIAVTFDADETYVIVANGIVSATGYDPVEPFTVYPFAPAREEGENANETDLLVFHGSTDAPEVSVWAMGGTSALFTFEYGDFAGYLGLPTDDYVLEIRTADGETTVVAYAAPLATLELEGAALTVVASGFLNPANNSDGPAFGLFVATPAGGELIALPVYEEQEPVIVGFPFFEDFETPENYSNWIIIDGSGSGFGWEIGDNDNFIVSDPMGGSFASVDSDAAGAGNNVWSILQAPIIDLADFEGGNIELSFAHHYRQIGAQEAYVKISNDGENWETIATYNSNQGSSAGFSGPFDVTAVTESLIIEGYTSSDSLWIRFEFDDNETWGWYWLIDNISVNTATEEPPMARAQIIHNAADMAAASVDVFVNGEIFVPDFAFRTATPFVDVPAGVELTIDIAPAGAGIENSVFDINVTFEADETYIIVANGIVSATGYDPVEPFTVYPFAGAREAANNANETDVLVFHGATDAPEVSVWETGVGAGELFSFAYGQFAGYLELGTLDYVIEVRTADGETTVVAYSAPLQTLGLDGAAITVVASGFLNPANNSDGPAFGLFVALPSGGDLIALPVYEEPQPEFARAQIIHNAADIAAANVDVFVNGEIFVPNFAFRTATPFVDVPAGVELTIDIAPAGAGIENSVFDITVEFEADETYIIIANGIVSASGYDPAEPFTVYPFAGAREMASSENETDVLVFHGATDAPVVSVWETGVGAGELFSFGYGQYAGYLELGTLDYVLEVRTEDGSTTVAAYSAPLQTLGLEGAAITVVASGFLNPANNSNGPDFGLYVALATGGDLIALPVITNVNLIDSAFDNFNVYPNPVRDNLNISLNMNRSGNVSVEIFNILGSRVYFNELGNRSDMIMETINVSWLPQGAYILNVRTSDDVITRKINVVK
ncbi:MAG: DUF4397 domain-containing protein, partial [Bacteroidales bacterium]|nr:DUF4397 domain-containing protein [Bacteroidales bacterium]